MGAIVSYVQLFSSLSFFIYGSSCLMSKKMFLEFQRYNLSSFRLLTGILQIAGSIGLVAGFYFHFFTLMSSLGLAVQMLLGVLVRIRIKDPIYQVMPAFLFFCINSFIFYMSL